MRRPGPDLLHLALTLRSSGFTLSVSTPTPAHDCAKALLKRAKTEALAARDPGSPGGTAPTRSPLILHPLSLVSESRGESSREARLKLRQPGRESAACSDAASLGRLLRAGPPGNAGAPAGRAGGSSGNGERPSPQPGHQLGPDGGEAPDSQRHRQAFSDAPAGDDPEWYRAAHRCADSGLCWMGALSWAIRDEWARPLHQWADWPCPAASRTFSGQRSAPPKAIRSSQRSTTACVQQASQ